MRLISRVDPRARSDSSRSRARVAVLLAILVAVAAACGQGAVSSSPPSPAGSPSGATSSPSAAGTVPGSPVPGSVAWRACGDGLECGRIEVPLDHSQPDGSKIWVYLARISARDPVRRVGSLVLNFGGPGVAGVGLLQNDIAQNLPDTLLDRFDIVSFDPRGTGQSSPIFCVNDSMLDAARAIDPIARTAAEREAIERVSRDFAAGCAERNAGLLGHVSTDDIARDLDLIRAAIGDDRLTYMGYSYGTYLGARYATLFPDRVRAIVLDAAIDGGRDPIAIVEEQVKASEAALDRFLSACASRTSCAFHGGDDPAAAFDRLVAGIGAKPIDAGERSLGLGDALTGIVGLLAGADADQLAAALVSAEKGDGSVLLTAADLAAGRSGNGQYDSSIGASTATICMDASAVPDIADWVALASRTAREAPRLGGGFGVGCIYWPVHPAAAPGPLSAPAGTPVVVIGATGDPITPYAWSEQMVKTLGNAVLVTRKGEGHTTLADPRNACISDVVTAYLVDLRVPAASLAC